jgi:RNA polymerase sigma-70 factor (ECF subfamily)
MPNMVENRSFTALMADLRLGEQAAAQAVFSRYAQQLIALARSKLDQRLQQRVDPEDVIQSVYKSFFLRHREGQVEVVNWQSLWGLLTLITLRKCADRAHYFQADRRNIAREIAADTDAHPGWQESIGREPSPDEAALLAETVETLLRGLDRGEREIVELSLQGFSTQEISERLGRAERSVRRLRERVRLQLEQMQN